MPRHHDRNRSLRRRPFRKTRRPARRVAVERLEPRRLLSTTPLGVNVVQNPGAEQGNDHWQADGTPMAVVGYGAFNVPAQANAPPNGGQNLWYGGEREELVSFAAGADGWAMLLETEPESGTASIEAQTVDAAGVTYVVGSFSGSLDFDPRPNSELILAADGDEGAGFIARYDAAGGVLGAWQIGAGVEAVAAANGRLALAGTFRGTAVDLDPRADVTTSFGGADEQYGFVLTINAITGEPVSTTLLSVTAADGVNPSLWYTYGGTIDAVMLADDGRVFLGGRVRSATVSGPTAGGGLVSLGVPNNESDGYVAAIDPSGFVSWAVRLEGDPAMYVPATVGGMALAGDLLALGVARSGPLGSLPNEPEAVEGMVVIGLEAATGGYRWHTSVADGAVDNGDPVPVAATADGRVHAAGYVWTGDYETGTVNTQVATIDAATGSLVGAAVSVGDLVGGSGTFYAVALLPQADNSTILMAAESFADTMDRTFHLLDLGPSGESDVSLVADWSATQSGWPLAASLAPDGRIVLLSSLDESDLFPIGTGGDPQRLVSATGYTTAVWSLREPFSGAGNPFAGAGKPVSGAGNPGTNEPPTLGLISDITIVADSSETEVTFSGVSAGGADTQALRITATSSDTGLIPDPTVVYASADATGTFTFEPVADAYGLGTITVTVADAGLDGDLDTADDNGVFSRSFEVTVLEIIATAGSTILGKDLETNVYANTQPITLDEQPLKMDTNGFTAIGAESAAAGNAVLLQREGTNYRLVAENTWQIIGMFDSLRNASALVLKPASREPQTFSLTAITGAYEIDGLANPTLTVHRGQKVTFDLYVPGHPFHLQTTGGGYAAAAVYTQGFAGDGQTSGQFEWIVPDDAPDELFYQCKFHSVMFGKISVID